MAGNRDEKGRVYPPLFVQRDDALRQRDRRAVAARRNRERTGVGVRGVGVRRAPRRRTAARRNGNRREEGTGRLTRSVLRLLRQVSEGGRERAHVCLEHRDGRGERPEVGLRLRHARAGLHVRVERDGDRRQDTDDRHDDHQFDEGEALLVAQLPVEELGHAASLWCEAFYPVSAEGADWVPGLLAPRILINQCLVRRGWGAKVTA